MKEESGPFARVCIGAQAQEPRWSVVRAA